MRIYIIKLFLYIALSFISSAHCTIHHYVVVDQATKYSKYEISKGQTGKCSKPYIGNIEYDNQTNSSEMIIGMREFSYNKITDSDLVIKAYYGIDGLIHVTWTNAQHAFKPDEWMKSIETTKISREESITCPFVDPPLPENIIGTYSGESSFPYPETIEEKLEYSEITNIINQGTIILQFKEYQTEKEISPYFMLSRMLMGRFSAIPTDFTEPRNRRVHFKLTKHNFQKIIEGLSILINFQRTTPVYQNILGTKNVIFSNQTVCIDVPTCVGKPASPSQTTYYYNQPAYFDQTTYYNQPAYFNQTTYYYNQPAFSSQQPCLLPLSSSRD